MEGTKARAEGSWLPPAKGRRRTFGGMVLRALRVGGWVVGMTALMLATVWLWGGAAP